MHFPLLSSVQDGFDEVRLAVCDVEKSASGFENTEDLVLNELIFSSDFVLGKDGDREKRDINPIV